MHLSRSALIAATYLATTALALPRPLGRTASYSVVNVDGSQPPTTSPTTVIETKTQRTILHQTVTPAVTVTVDQSPHTVTIDAEPSTMTVTTSIPTAAPYSASMPPVAPVSSSVPPAYSYSSSVAPCEEEHSSTPPIEPVSTSVMRYSSYPIKSSSTPAPYPYVYATGAYYPIQPTGGLNYYGTSASAYSTGAYAYPSLRPTGYPSPVIVPA